MNILQINTADKGGGAEGSALNLFRIYRERGHLSYLEVGTKYTNDPDILEIPRPAPAGLKNKCFHALAQWCHAKDIQGKIPGMRKAARILDRCASPERFRDWQSGREEYDFPGCRQILKILPAPPDIIHCHNLHGWFFDLRVLPELSRRKPLILNLRDTWLLTGHCAYFMDCQRWRDACGNCPRLSVYPPIRKNATTQNWLRKQQIFNASVLYVTAPSQWLIEQAQNSMLQAIQYKVIPNGINTRIFYPRDRQQARESLGLPQDAPVVMFASAAAKNVFKDPQTLRDCLASLAARMPTIHFLGVGTQLGLNLPNLLQLPFVASPDKMAQCYSAADLFLHTAKAEAFGKTITEAMACGTPVAATAVGGIPEQIIPDETGSLASPENPDELADKSLEILHLPSPQLNFMRSASAARGATFSLEKQASLFLDWYQEIIQKRTPQASL